MVIETYDNFCRKCLLNSVDELTPNGKWQKLFAGKGSWESFVTRYDGIKQKGVFYLSPYRDIYTGSDTLSSLVVSTETWDDFDVTFEMRTVSALKTTFQQVWETAWVFWHYNENGYAHTDPLAFRNYYYFHLDTNGHMQINRKNADSIDQTRFLAGTFAQEPTFTWNYGQWYKIRIKHEGTGANTRIRVWVDDVLKFDKYDDGTLTDGSGTIPAPDSKVASGKFGLYCEDSKVEFKPLTFTS